MAAPSPVRLTFPFYDPGSCWVVADGQRVAHCLADHQQVWTARLWCVPEKPHDGFAGMVQGRKMAGLRQAVRERLEKDGPWWVADHPDGLE